MGVLHEDVVVISQAEKPGELTVITVNCPDKTGLGCDLCRVILLFGLSICREDAQTDGKWCYLVFWVVGKPNTRWNLLKMRLLEVCPSYFSTSEFDYYKPENQQPKPPDVFLLKFWCSYDREGLLHDVTEVLWELELTIKRVKVSTAPDGRVLDLCYGPRIETIHHLKNVLGKALISCEIELAGAEVTACSQGSSFLPPAFTEDMFNLELPNKHRSGFLAPSPVSVTVDNTLSPSHTLVQILCNDHKGLIYDIMRTLKDYHIQISYGRFFANRKGNCEVDLFLMQADGKKIVDPNKQNALCSRLRMELLHPVRLAVVSRGPDTELLVANPVELSGRGRPLVFHDITLALKTLNTCIFSVEIGRHMIHDREWEVYRILLDEGDGLPVSRNKIEEGVRKVLMGWD
ncbi:ACT domain-containing protein [Salix suchowensis]|nr:ACT domain-containing protein [Salix suchowensis]